MEKRPPENDLSYRDQLPKPGHTGDLYAHLLGADGEDPSELFEAGQEEEDQSEAS